MKTNLSFNISKAKSGMPTVSVQIKDQPEFFIHSIIDPVREGYDWQKNIAKSSHTAYLVYGFGLGYHVHALLKNLPEDCCIYVVEHSKEINLIKIAHDLFADNAWMEDQRIVYCGVENIREMATTIAIDMGKRRLKKLTVCRHFPYMQVFPEYYRQAEQDLVDKLGEVLMLNFNIRLTLGMPRMENAWLNVPYIWQNPGAEAFRNSFSGLPAIIVAAGPSLNKNIEILKQCQGRALIIAAGSAMGALSKHMITPHFLAVSDTGINMSRALNGVCNPETILLTVYEVNHSVVENYPGKWLFVKDYEKNSCLSAIESMLPITERIKQNISVASLAVNFALYCSANPIIFIGQDLSFPTESHHADGVKTNDYKVDEWVYVPGYYGGQVRTVFQLRDVIEYFQAMISANPHTSFINATEGGAKIEGTKQMTLNEVCENILPNETVTVARILDIFHNNSPNGYKKLFINLTQIRQNIQVLIQTTDDFSVETSNFINNTLCWDEASGSNLRSRFETYFAFVRNHIVYSYAKAIIDPLQELLEYSIREGRTFQQTIEAYAEFKNNLLLVLKKLDQALEKTLLKLTEMHEGMEMRETNE